MDVLSVNHAHTLAVGPVEAPSHEQRVENRELIQAVKAVEAAEMFGQDSELTFVLDRETHKPLARIVDRKTREVIRQIPPEVVLRLAEELKGG